MALVMETREEKHIDFLGGKLPLWCGCECCYSYPMLGWKEIERKEGGRNRGIKFSLFGYQKDMGKNWKGEVLYILY